MEDIVKDFVAESIESLQSLDQKFVELEKNPDDKALLNDIFRSVHTIKGASGFLGFKKIVEVTHAAEEILNRLRKGEMGVTGYIMDAILHSIDVIKALIRNVKEKGRGKEDIGPTVAILNKILDEAKSQKGAEPKEDFKGAPSAGPAPSASVNGAAEEALRAESLKETWARRSEDKEHNIRVDIGRLDAVMNLIGELVLARNRMMMLGSKTAGADAGEEFITHLDEGISQLDHVTTDLQLAVMKMRMQPIAKVFNRFPRMVRDLARQNNKEVELVMSGEETELDKTVIEEIGDPLVHLIRNSIDHGIEPPEERALRAKGRAGRITLSAYQEGQHIVVSVSDDGKGIDPEALKKSAIDKRLITADEAGRLSPKEAMNLIFIPGFSTAKNVSAISGRGVGMDVVKTNIARINGSINVESEVGKGMKITFRLPLTLAIIHVLTVQAGREIYGIPLSTVVENIRVTASDLKTVEGREVIHIRDRVFPVVRLGSLVKGGSGSFSDMGNGAGNGIVAETDVASGWMYIVIIGIGEKNLGLLVDRLHGQEEIVMKSMGEYLKGTEGVAGACINGEGNVILILDVADLMEATHRAYANQAGAS